MDPTWAPEVRQFLLGCLVAQCEQSPSAALCNHCLFFGGKKTSPHPPAPAGIVSLFFPSCLFPPRRMDRRRPSDTADRPAPETVGPGFHRRPSSVRLGNGRTPCGGRAAGRLPKDQLTSISTGGEERRCEIKYWIFFGKGAVGALYFWRKATKEAAKASQHVFFFPPFWNFTARFWPVHLENGMFVLPRQKLRGKLVATMHQTHPDTRRSSPLG